jgi:hypothetical protein
MQTELEARLVLFEQHCRCRGLANPATEFRCFLNTAIQMCLWNASLAEIIRGAPLVTTTGEALQRVQSRMASTRLGNAPVATAELQAALRAGGGDFADGRMHDVTEAIEAILRQFAANTEPAAPIPPRLGPGEDPKSDHDDDSLGTAESTQEYFGSVATADEVTTADIIQQCSTVAWQSSWTCRNPACRGCPADTTIFTSFAARMAVYPTLYDDGDAPLLHATGIPFGPAVRAFAGVDARERTCDVCNEKSAVRSTVTRWPTGAAFVDLVWHKARPAFDDVARFMRTVLQDEFDLRELMCPDDTTAGSSVVASVETVALFRSLHYVTAVRAKSGPKGVAGWWLLNDEEVSYIAGTWAEFAEFVVLNRWMPRALGLTIFVGGSPSPSPRPDALTRLPTPVSVRSLLADVRRSAQDKALAVVMDVMNVDRATAQIALREGSRLQNEQSAINWLAEGGMESYNAARRPPLTDIDVDETPATKRHRVEMRQAAAQLSKLPATLLAPIGAINLVQRRLAPKRDADAGPRLPQHLRGMPVKVWLPPGKASKRVRDLIESMGGKVLSKSDCVTPHMLWVAEADDVIRAFAMEADPRARAASPASNPISHNDIHYLFQSPVSLKRVVHTSYIDACAQAPINERPDVTKFELATVAPDVRVAFDAKNRSVNQFISHALRLGRLC